MNKKLLIVAMASLLGLTACGDGDDGAQGKPGANGAPGPAGSNGTPAYTSDIQFGEIAPAITSSEKNSIRTTSKAMVGGESQLVGYHLLMATGDADNGEIFGLVKDFENKVVKYEDNSNYLCNGTDSGEGSGLDHFSLLQKNDKLYMVAQFECATGAIYMSELDQDANGKLTAKAGTLQFVSQASEFGGWVHCAGMTTPWQSHLGSEEYEQDAKTPTGAYYNEVTARYWRGDATKNNPYYYGWTPEVQVKADGKPNYIKHYSMGRFAHELAYVMPDMKTTYLTDDGTDVGLFMFVADTAKDLSAGTLYAAKWQQTSSEGIGKAVLRWIDLGHATNAQIRAVVAAKKTFTDIFASEVQNPDGTCPTVGFSAIKTANGKECLKLNDVNKSGAVDAVDEVIASRLETRRFAAMKGATTEFRKEEGITFNARDNQLYIAMSEVGKGMSDAEGDIQLAANKCGGVYALGVAMDSAIGSDYVAYDMKGLIAGAPMDYTGTALEGNSCDVDSLASPDNVTFLEGTDILVIGEDTDYHPNDMVWAFDVTKKAMTRIASTPYGSESTSPFWHKNINGFGYLTLTTQHPFGEVSSGYVRPAGADIRSTAGYIGPFNFSNIK